MKNFLHSGTLVIPKTASNSIFVKAQEFLISSYFGKISLLFLGLVAVSFSSIFIYLGEQELTSSSIVFNRFWITTIIYGIWSGLRRFPCFYKNLDLENSISFTDGVTQNPPSKSSIWNRQTILTMNLSH